jgi:putative MATE family efflux protein
MTIPMIWGILAIMSMNLVDTFYVAQLGTEPLAAMGFTIPIVSILLSLAFGVGIGVSSVISRAIGSGEQTLVKSYATQSLFIGLSIAISFAIVGYHFMDEIFMALGAPKSLMPRIHQFMDIWFLGSFVVIIPMVGNSALRAAGNTKVPGFIMVLVAVINIILDPILIFGWFGFPRMELAGAALATVISYSAALLLSLYLLMIRMRFLSLSACKGLVIKSWKDILYIAIPAVGTNLIAPISVAITTWMVAQHSAEAVAGFGVASRIESICLVVIMGISSIMGPFVGQNLGAKRYDRIVYGLKISIRFVCVWSLSIALLLGVFGDSITRAFTDDPLVQASATSYFIWVPITYAFLGIIMLVSSMSNGLGRPTPSLVMSFLRLVGLYLPLAFLLGDMLGLEGIYLAGAIANILVGALALMWKKKLLIA